MWLVQGSFQQLGTSHYRLLRMLGGVTRVDMDRLDAVEPDWRDQTTVAKPVHYMYDEDTPKEFYVYPPVQPGVQVTANIAVHPVEIDDLTDLVPIDDMYQPVIVDYLIHRAYGKHSKAAGNQANSDAAFMRFAQALGVKLNVLAQASPNNETVPS